ELGASRGRAAAARRLKPRHATAVRAPGVSGRLTLKLGPREVSAMTTRRLLLAVLLPLTALFGGCAPEVGSEAWCEALAEKPRGDWTANEGLDYARHCIIR